MISRIVEWIMWKLEYEEITGMRAEMVRAALEE